MSLVPAVHFKTSMHWQSSGWKTRRSQIHTITSMSCTYLGLKGIEIYKPFEWDDHSDCRDPAKVFDKFQASFHTPNIQCSYVKEAFELKWGTGKTIKQWDVHLTNALLKCGYSEDQLDSYKVDTFLHSEYHDIKWFVSMAPHQQLPDPAG